MLMKFSVKVIFFDPSFGGIIFCSGFDELSIWGKHHSLNK